VNGPRQGTLDSVLVTAELSLRPVRARAPADLDAAILRLTDELASPSRYALQRVVEEAMVLCRAGSAGVSLLEASDGRERFRWHAVSGALREYLWSALPRELSLGHIVIERDAAQLFRYPERYLTPLSERRPQLVECLCVPLRAGSGAPFGTIWIASHDQVTAFDREDLRVLETLGHFAVAAHRAYATMEAERAGHQRKDELLAALSSELRDALAAISNAVEYLVAEGECTLDERRRVHGLVQRQLGQIGQLSEQMLDSPSVGTRVTRRASAPLVVGGRPKVELKRQRVLIIDDSVDSADSLGMLLRVWGHDVRTAQGAVAGLQLEWEFEPHAVILDIEMPGKNGYEVASELRVRRRRDLLLVALSGYVREEDRARSLAAGFDHHMTKPADVALLERLLC
jgi:CheY-like chemotaxis protein/GAF domain-containing protein